MMPLTSPRGSRSSQDQEGSDAYGTFQPLLRSPATPGRHRRHGTPQAASRLVATSASSAWSSWVGNVRIVGVVGMLLLAAFAVFSSQPHGAGVASASVSSSVLAKSDPAERSAVEQAFVSGVQASKLQEFLHAYASVPHVCGSEQDYETALYTKKQFEAYGIDAEIKEYYTLLSYPVRSRLAIVGPEPSRRELNLTEATVEGDSCTTNEDALPPFLAYAASGNATGSIVYVNFGSQADFEWLVAHNVSLKGKIALARYGGIGRDIKAMLSETHGMAGVLIYSDPNEDGFVRGKTYPDGPWRPKGSFQRGSISYASYYAGDPLTPGYASVLGAPYVSLEGLIAVPTIPALPLSYEQATFILQSLGGTKAPEDWQGGLTLANGGYFLGNDGSTVVNLDLEMDNKVMPIWDVIGTIKGSELPHEQVLIGNHRDAWVCGAVDPSSGSAAMMELARGFGDLLKSGWKPRRTIKLASWDGEEYSLIGSTEYAEEYAETLIEEAVAYINVDAFLGPLVAAGGSPSIAEFLLQTAKAVPADHFQIDGRNASSLHEQWTLQSNLRKTANGGVTAGLLAPDYVVNFLGSGTDFTAYYQHLGIASANLAFGLTDSAYGVYHSTMDSVAYVESFADPSYATHVTATQWWGLLTLRLADNAVLPYEFTTYGPVMQENIEIFETKTAALDLSIDYEDLRTAIQHFTTNAKLFQTQLESIKTNSTALVDASLLYAWNQKLKLLERKFILDSGLPHRPWYKHVIFGPGFYEVYAGTAFPGIADGIAFYDNDTTIQEHVQDVARVVEQAASFLVAP